MIIFVKGSFHKLFAYLCCLHLLTFGKIVKEWKKQSGDAFSLDSASIWDVIFLRNVDYSRFFWQRSWMHLLKYVRRTACIIMKRFHWDSMSNLYAKPRDTNIHIKSQVKSHYGEKCEQTCINDVNAELVCFSRTSIKTFVLSVSNTNVSSMQ